MRTKRTKLLILPVVVSLAATALWSQTSSLRQSFDVASLKPVKITSPYSLIRAVCRGRDTQLPAGVTSIFSPGRCTFQNITLNQLMSWAYLNHGEPGMVASDNQ